MARKGPTKDCLRHVQRSAEADSSSLGWDLLKGSRYGTDRTYALLHVSKYKHPVAWPVLVRQT